MQLPPGASHPLPACPALPAFARSDLRAFGSFPWTALCRSQSGRSELQEPACRSHRKGAAEASSRCGHRAGLWTPCGWIF